jgi:hypothetical protein
MSAAKRLVACLVVMAGCLAALWSIRDRPGPCPAPEYGLLLPAGPEHRILLRRMDARLAIVERVLAGQMSLLQAAAQFRKLNNDPPEFPVYLHHHPGKSEGEKLCRQVIEWADNSLHAGALTPAEIEAALCPLRRELEALLEQKDEIDLPAVD